MDIQVAVCDSSYPNASADKVVYTDPTGATFSSKEAWKLVRDPGATVSWFNLFRFTVWLAILDRLQNV